jgi:hypothetical protein
VVKNRFDGQLGRFTLRFDKERLSFSRLSSSRDESNHESADPEQQQSVPIQQ